MREKLKPLPDDNIDSPLSPLGKQIKSYIRSRAEEIDPVRLNKARFLNPHLRLTPPQKAVADNLLRALEPSQKIFREARTETFEILCANLVYSTTNPLIIPMDTHYWIGEGKTLSSTVIKDVKLLKEQNYIGVKQGNRFIKRYTRIYPKKGFNMLPLRQNPGIDYKPDKFVILRETVFKGYRHFDNPLTGKTRTERDTSRKKRSHLSRHVKLSA